MTSQEHYKKLMDVIRFAALGNGIEQLAWIFSCSYHSMRQYVTLNGIAVYRKRKRYIKYLTTKTRTENIFEMHSEDTTIKHTILFPRKIKKYFVPAEPFVRPPAIYSNRSPFGIADELRKLEYAV